MFNDSSNKLPTKAGSGKNGSENDCISLVSYDVFNYINSFLSLTTTILIISQLSKNMNALYENGVLQIKIFNFLICKLKQHAANLDSSGEYIVWNNFNISTKRAGLLADEKHNHFIKQLVKSEQLKVANLISSNKLNLEELYWYHRGFFTPKKLKIYRSKFSMQFIKNVLELSAELVEARKMAESKNRFCFDDKDKRIDLFSHRVVSVNSFYVLCNNAIQIGGLSRSENEEMLAFLTNNLDELLLLNSMQLKLLRFSALEYFTFLNFEAGFEPLTIKQVKTPGFTPMKFFEMRSLGKSFEEIMQQKGGNQEEERMINKTFQICSIL